MKGKSILLISPEPWEGHRVSKHHYATVLAEMGNRVYFLDPLFGSFHSEDIDLNLSVVKFKGHLRGLRFIPSFLQAIFIARDLKKLELAVGEKFDVVWNFDSSRFYNLLRVRNKLRICHIVDLNQDFKREILAKTSDFCFCSSDPIFSSLRLHSSKVFKINHGLKIPGIGIEELTLPGTNRIKAIYSGNLDISYLDHQLLDGLISNFKDVDFIFIGAYSDSNPLALKVAANMFLLGMKPAADLQSYYKRADVLLVTYLADEFLEQLANPHKILEYLYSGKVVLATKTLEYLSNELIVTGSSYSDFLEKFRNIKDNLQHFNSEVKSREREAFALDNSYEKQVMRIARILEEK